MGQNLLSDPRNNEQQPQCVLSSDVLANNSMKPTKPVRFQVLTVMSM
jgi:hypothetical protein